MCDKFERKGFINTEGLGLVSATNRLMINKAGVEIHGRIKKNYQKSYCRNWNKSINWEAAK